MPHIQLAVIILPVSSAVVNILSILPFGKHFAKYFTCINPCNLPKISRLVLMRKLGEVTLPASGHC